MVVLIHTDTPIFYEAVIMLKTTPLSASTRSVSHESLAEGSRPSIGGDIKSTQVLPVGPTIMRQGSSTKRKLSDTQKQQLSFLEAFGILGILMVLILALCLAWTIWTIFVLLAPNEAANWLMSTGDYDNGQFWLIIDTNPVLTFAGVFCLTIVSLSYLFVTLKMLLWREVILTPAKFRQLEKRLFESWNRTRLESRTWSLILGPTYQRISYVWKDLTSFNGKKRKLWVSMKCAIDRYQFSTYNNLCGLERCY
ncbi:unnamed protein product [Phytophthora fragariaefolia]|uniref:Unnamed protein product n=1 Tax=Phytophthora fragariaefolia TaxID=1490495 RepID=A0A9W6YBK3_9STRA|nr:unnamed protein product [Phytophthora fragariaefolia]